MRDGMRVRDLGNPEIEHLHVSVERDEDILRRHVAMDDAQRPPREVRQLVGVMQAFQGLDEDAEPERQG